MDNPDRTEHSTGGSLTNETYKGEEGVMAGIQLQRRRDHIKSAFLAMTSKLASTRIQKSLLFALCFCLVLVAEARAFNLEERIIGKWYEMNGMDVIEIVEGGRIFVAVKGFSFEGTYDFIDDKHARCDFKFGSFIYKVGISEETLILTNTNGKVTKYHRKTRRNERNSST